MAALMNRTQVEVKKTTTDIKVDENNYSKLMYYVNCVATVLRLDDDPEISRLRNYKQYRNLTEQEKQKLIIFCLLFDPDELNDKVIFQEDSMCHEYQNEFYDLSVASTTLAVSQSIVLGGTRRQVRKIMCYTKSWVKENYTDPLTLITSQQQRSRQAAVQPRTDQSAQQRPQPQIARSRSQRESSGRCTIM